MDGSFVQETGEGAIACVCRNSHGFLIDGFARTVGVNSAIHAEATAIVEALKYFQGRAELVLEMETDQFDLESEITADQVSWEVHALITEAQARLGNFHNLKLTHCKRVFNKVADWVVKAHRNKTLPFNWASYPPLSLSELLCSEANILHSRTIS